ncbi:hypothetical protein HKBW3S42_01077 [Candidatus Hakubella thermalkaliphila]|uniref:Uncharacterized protein n=1 Tax=Candidatus Hakubella thermalkaliphila TaxID=2754717 RepID=A0A6V8PPJ0_9ACTN|nr:hypothetical protein HKBW3S42_01077 [Candidatus Hakubella thermalkaliphila]
MPFINRLPFKTMGVKLIIHNLSQNSRFKYKGMSIFGTACRLGLPATVHVAIGTDIIHMHPHADGASIGEGSLRDFKLFTSVVSDLEGGVYINLGSAVIMPEVFLKALTIARNLGSKVENITTVNMDFIQHYRPAQNVLRRPTLQKGCSYALTGHHEIMFPLLAAAIIEKLWLHKKCRSENSERHLKTSLLYRSGTIRSATMFTTFIIGLIAGPALSL